MNNSFEFQEHLSDAGQANSGPKPQTWAGGRPGEVAAAGARGPGEQHQEGRDGGRGDEEPQETAEQRGQEEPGAEGDGEEESQQGEGGGGAQGQAGGHHWEAEEGELSYN